jgi:hypothetical protein
MTARLPEPALARTLILVGEAEDDSVWLAIECKSAALKRALGDGAIFILSRFLASPMVRTPCRRKFPIRLRQPRHLIYPPVRLWTEKQRQKCGLAHRFLIANRLFPNCEDKTHPAGQDRDGKTQLADLDR